MTRNKQKYLATFELFYSAYSLYYILSVMSESMPLLCERSVKIVFVGPSGSGKTTLMQHAVGDRSPHSGPTIGCNGCRIESSLSSRKLWETAGQEKFNLLVPLYTRDAHMFIITLSAEGDGNLLNDLSQWEAIISDAGRADSCSLFTVFNKADIAMRRNSCKQKAGIHTLSKDRQKPRCTLASCRPRG